MNMNALPDDALSVDEAAAYLGVSRFTLNNWRRANMGPVYWRHRIQRRIFYSRADLDTFLVERTERIEPERIVTAEAS